jgi:hypothetical protein
MPAAIVIPLREVPGNSASAWAQPKPSPLLAPQTSAHRPLIPRSTFHSLFLKLDSIQK